MQSSVALLAVTLSIVLAAPASDFSSDQFPSPWFPWVGGGAMASTFPFAGAAAAAGAFNPWSPMAPMWPTPWPFGGWPRMPVPTFPTWPSQWYTGPNVCNKTMKSSDPQVIQNFLQNSGVTFFVFGTGQGRTKECKGDESRYVCLAISSGSGNQPVYEATIYECCHGFKWDLYGGCAENPSAPGSPLFYSTSSHQASSSMRGSYSESSPIPKQENKFNYQKKEDGKVGDGTIY